MASIHYSPYAGSWYPGDEGELRDCIESLLENSRRRAGPWMLPNPIAFVVPHAGLMYSGTVAAAAYAYLQIRKPRRAVLLAFSHRGGPAGVAIPDVEALASPLGTTRVDRGAADRLLEQPGFHRVLESCVCDHSLEMQLPLLQHVAPETQIVPLYVGRMTEEEQESAARALAEMAGEDTVFLASSDLTHFGRAFRYEPFPADDCAAEKLRELDGGVMEDAGSLNARLFLDGLANSGATVCGRNAIALLLRVLSVLQGGEVFQEILDYQTSGEITGDYRHSVSYGALGYFPAGSFDLEVEDAACLLECARATLARFGLAPPAQIRPALQRRAGVFVTLRQGGSLRGCVGAAGGRGSLAQTVPEMVMSAALHDPRFPPLTPCAARSVEIEISLLSPLKRIGSRDSYRLHEHGAHLDCGGYRSLLLPQVARERGWTAAEFWEALARKAELTAEVYADRRTRLHVFRAQVIR